MKSRAYHSPLRAEQAEATRERILDALEALVREGDRELAVAAVARRAKVSLPTIYRHFATRDALLRALGQRFEAQRAYALPDVVDEAGLVELLRSSYAHFDEESAPPRLSAVFELSRVHTVPRRRALFAGLLARRAPRLPEQERGRVLDLLVVLASSATLEAFRGYLERDARETGECVLLCVDALFAHAESLQPPESP